MEKYNIIFVHGNTHYKWYDEDINMMEEFNEKDAILMLNMFGEIDLDDKDYIDENLGIKFSYDDFIAVKTNDRQKFFDYIKLSGVSKIYIKEAK